MSPCTAVHSSQAYSRNSTKAGEWTRSIGSRPWAVGSRMGPSPASRIAASTRSARSGLSKQGRSCPSISSARPSWARCRSEYTVLIRSTPVVSSDQHPWLHPAHHRREGGGTVSPAAQRQRSEHDRRTGCRRPTSGGGRNVKVDMSVIDFLDRAEMVYRDRVAVVDEPDQPAPSW